MIYGTPDDRNMWRLLRFLNQAPAVPLPNGGTNLQQPVHVADLANTIVAAIEREESLNRVYNVAGPEPLSFRKVVEEACQAIGCFPRPIALPAEPLRRGLSALERRGMRTPIKAEQVARIIEDKTFDITPAIVDLGFASRPFSNGIQEEAELGRHLLSSGFFRRTHVPNSSGDHNQ
jgi:nucleoside-diphosphate-sugar epimerase